VPSSTSSSDPQPDRYARATASDRPGVAQPVPVRPIPALPWRRLLLGALVLFLILIGGWEAYWRAYGVVPGIRNTFGLWAIQRRRIDAGEGDATVLLGSSRTYFDLQLPVWQSLAGRAPIQLSYEGTSPMTAVEDLAADPKFTGRLIIGVAPELFFSGGGFALGAAKYARKESPAQRVGQWLSMRLIEPYFAFFDADYALRTVLARQPWPQRPGKHWFTDVRKLANYEAGRNAHLWSKVETDPAYRALARSIWADGFITYPGDPKPEDMLKTEKEQIERATKAVAQLRAHGVKVLFIRLPSEGPYLEYEEHFFPRQRAWDGLLAATGTPGLYFADYPELRGFYLPEWSHMTQSEAQRFTVAFYQVLQRDFWGPQAPGSGDAPRHGAPALK
jgi:hypothetical protein